MPDHRGTCVVEHPLNDAGSLILVAAVGFVHRPHAFVGLHLRLGSEVVHVVRLAVAVGQGVTEYADGFEFAATGVIVPNVIDRPHMIFADHGADAFDWRNGWSHAGFGVEAVRAAAAAGIAQLAAGLAFGSVNLPIAGSYIFVRPAHLDAAVAGD